MSSCPNYLEYEIAVLRSNIAACHLKLEDWKAAVDAATASLDALDRLQSEDKDEKPGNNDGEMVEIEGEGDAAEQQLATLKTSDERKADIQRIRAKALMRRAKARSEQGGWGNLQGAEEGDGLVVHALRMPWAYWSQTTGSLRRCLPYPYKIRKSFRKH